MSKKKSEEDEIIFEPSLITNKDDISLYFMNLEFDDNEILEVHGLSDKWDGFLSEKEYQLLIEEYLNVKKSNINMVYSNPLYFIKKIIYFFNKETFFNPFMIILKSPPDTSNKSPEQKVQTISFRANISEDNGKASINLDIKNKILDGTINPGNKNVSFSFDIKDKTINIPINNYDKANNEIKIIPKLKEKEKKELPQKENKVPSRKKKDKPKSGTNNNLSNNNSQNNNEINNKNSNSIKNSFDTSKENNYNNSSLANETLLSYEDKDFENFNILVRENNENLLNEFHREKIEGTTFESIANKTFELMCNISLNRNIEVKNYIDKSPKRINDFFNLQGENKIKHFQIDSHISKLRGKELKKIKDKFKDNFFFFENLNLNDSDNYELIGEISQNITNNSRQKISQQFNYIYLIREFNNYAEKENKNFISLCKSYGFSNYEKIFILITDGSYIKTKYLINIIKDKNSEIEKLINERKDKKEIMIALSGYIKDKKALDLLEINLERFYYFCLFYNNLKNSGIKFCFCFIADIIEDKLENILEEKIKLYKNDDKDIEQKIKIGKESKEKMEIKKPNEFITKIKDIIEKNNKIKSSLIIISDEINRKIKDFIDSKNIILKKLDDFFVSFNNNNKNNFFAICNKILGSWKEQDSLIKRIYLDKMFFFFIFFLPKENNIDVNEIKNTIKNNLQGLSFEVIQKDKKEEIDNYIQSQNIKDKVKLKIIISKDKNNIMYMFGSVPNKNEYFFFNLENNNVDINLSNIIDKNFNSSVDLFFDDFYQKNKNHLSGLKGNKEILSRNNIIKKIGYDLELLKIKTENNNFEAIPMDFSFKTSNNINADEKLKIIGKEYYDSMTTMIKELLDIAKIKKNNNVLKFLKKKKKFLIMFNNLTENLRYKCFYKFVLFEYIKNLVAFNNGIVLNKIILKEIIK